jgi:hypothetical protein
MLSRPYPLLLPLLVLGACSSPAAEPDRAGSTALDAAPIPAAATFEARLPGEVQLLADRLELSGPPELLDHLAVLQAEDRIESSPSVRQDGLFTRHRVLQPGLDAVQAQLDRWQLSAFESLDVLLGAPGLTLSLEARGGVRLVAAGVDLSAERMRFELDPQGRLWRTIDTGAREPWAPVP